MAAEMEAEEARIGQRQRGKREERRRGSKCAKNAFIFEWCDAGDTTSRGAFRRFLAGKKHQNLFSRHHTY
jgi:hypothetical protein